MRAGFFLLLLCFSLLQAQAKDKDADSENPLESPPLAKQIEFGNEIPETFLGRLYLQNPIYALPYYYSFSKPYDSNIANEVKYQFSFRIPIVNLNKKYFIFFAYTQTSFFQLYNKADSRPFRDIDYSPELYWAYENASKTLRHIRIGFKHTSNGERALRSRTQNQILGSLKLQHNFSERAKVGAVLNAWIWTGLHYDGFLHDNPDLVRYRGYADILLYANYGDHLLEAYLTPIVADYSFYKPRFVLGYTYRLTHNIGLYVQYTNGYGDNIYEYNIHSNRAGLGVRLWQNL
ncbi:phospholipase [Helicobacter sp. MIT 00-7814]|uniref:phospholipase A n=1 Tax=unclassified Helicobacter TaxID=2593540 RepID=UPI000E1F9B28|nr:MULTISPECIES: phospholipase A [unclassified Helicobacter]RDU54790.1 phospholipase [Helicobacter sp. MIT 99-10781]RDU54848.1 phospholipase [Helicobacter sp. MIT 00-7814]